MRHPHAVLPQTTIHVTRKGLEIALKPTGAEPSRPKLPPKQSKTDLLLFLVGVGMSVGCLLVIWLTPRDIQVNDPFILWFVLAAIGLMWSAALAWVTAPTSLRRFFSTSAPKNTEGVGRETVRLEGHTLTIGTCLFGRSAWGMLHPKRFDLVHIGAFHVNATPQQTHGTLCFESAKAGPIQFFEHTPLHDAQEICQALNTILAFRCHAVNVILFGDAPLEGFAPEVVLCNPDVTTLTFPFVHVQRIVIQTASYDFHLVERFITYAVNYIGQDYLKQHVEVHLYGDPDKLHPNLRNSLTNLSKEVHLYA